MAEAPSGSGRKTAMRRCIRIAFIGLMLLLSLRMWKNIHDVVDIILNQEVKAPALVHTGLPEILAFIVLLGAEGWMVQVVK
jgi:hypothetical protein